LKLNISRSVVNYTSLPALLCILSGCSLLPASTQAPTPVTEGQKESSYVYIPIDPLATSASLSDVCPAGYKVAPYIGLLPDEAVRIGITNISGSASLGSVVGVSGNTYQVTMDYISVDTKPIPTFVVSDDSTKAVGSNLAVRTYTITKDPANPVWYSYNSNAKYPSPPANSRSVVFPVYVGVGLRLTATITVLKGSLNLSSLGAIAASVSAGDSSGSLVVQVIGVSGPKVSNLFPFVTTLDQTTIQNALVALGSIKAVLYDDTTNVVPRVVGLSNPIGGGVDAVNQLISILASDRVVADESCTAGAAAAPPAAAPKPGATPGAVVPGGSPASNSSGQPASNTSGTATAPAKKSVKPEKGKKEQAIPSAAQ
jgi:hypothetical protein